MRIGELARLSGVKAPTIRFYENAGLMAAAPRTSGNYRDYDDQDLQRLVLIRDLRSVGFEMDEVARLLPIILNNDAGVTPATVADLKESVAAKSNVLLRVREALGD